MKIDRSPRLVMTTATVLAIAVAVLGPATLGAEIKTSEQSFIQRVVAQTTRTGLAIRATREMRAGTVSGKHQGWMRVETTLTPSGRFSWQVIDEGGSDRTRAKVFHPLLETEAESSREGDRDAAALTPDNYIFTPLSHVGSAEVHIRLQPRRRDSRLIEGVLTVSADGYPVRLDGKLAKSPSFWVKSVHIVKEYGRFNGVALPTLLQSTADLKLFGKSTLTMRYSYSEVNGRGVRGSALVASSNP